MINFDSLTLKAFYLENKDFLEGAKIQKIQMPSKRELILQLRNRSETKKLYINVYPEFAHICFTQREFSQPKTPPMFCMLLRKHLEGAKIKKTNVPEYERIFEIFTEGYSETGDYAEFCLVAEFMGKHSNAILYNFDTSTIFGCVHNINSEKSKERELYGGLPYSYPPRQAKKDIRTTSLNDFLNILKNSDETVEFTVSKNFYHISTALAEEIYNHQADKEKFFEELKETVSLKNTEPSISYEKTFFSLYGKDKSVFSTASSISAMIDAYFSFHIEKKLYRTLKREILSLLDSQKSKLLKTIEKHSLQQEKSKNATTYKKKADIIMANLYKLKGGEKSALLNDFETNSQVKIDLDETKSPQENAARYYKLYTKYKSASSHASELLEAAEKKLSEIEDKIFSAEISNSKEDLTLLKEELKKEDPHKKRKDTAIFVEEQKIENARIFIGKNSKQNDYLLKHIAAPEDIWMHALNTPSAHIIIKIESEKDLTPTVLEQSALLTKQFSKAKDAGKTSIIYTKRKFVKKPPNSPSGFVTYKNEKEIVI